MKHREGWSEVLALLGMSKVEHRLVATQMELEHRVLRARTKMRMALPYAIVTVALALYAAGTTALAFRKHRLGALAPAPRIGNAE
jgi:hypothetical protein